MISSPPGDRLPAEPFFSILILCWNSNQYLGACLDALRAQTDRDFEILLVDNGSSQPIPPEILARNADIIGQVHVLPENIGFAGGNNFAAARARGQYLALLNTDAFPQPDWLAAMRQAIGRSPRAFFTSKLVKAGEPDRLDGTGDVYHASGLVWRRHHGWPCAAVTDRQAEVFSACGAAAVYPRAGFEAVNGFDPDFFAYVEDIDLGFRLRLAGYRCIYLPSAVVRHVGSGSSGYRSNFSVYYGQRNLVWAYIKNMPGALVWLLSPWHLLANLMQIVPALYRRQARVTLKAKLDALKGLPAMLRKRRGIQRRRQASILQVVKVMNWDPFSPLGKIFNDRRGR